jgi:hypothetical protein
VKFDFLGLKTLSVLKKATDLLEKRGVSIDLSQLALDDPTVYELLKSGHTVGVFQLESEGMRRTLTAVKPTNFGDIIALVSLYRPGPMDNIPLFGQRKAGEVEKASSPRHTGFSSIRNRSCRPRRSLPDTRSAMPTFCAVLWARRCRPRWTPSATVSSTGVPKRAESMRRKPMNSSI